MLADRIDYKKAALALYALQTAALNVKHTTFNDLDNNWQEYSPEFDPALPECEEEETAPQEKKTAKSVKEGEVIPKIEARAERMRSTSPKKPVRRATAQSNAALVQSALKHLKRRGTA